MSVVKYKKENFYATPIRKSLMTIVVMGNADKKKIILLFGSKRIRDAFESELKYKILKFGKSSEFTDSKIEINNRNFHKFVVEIEPFKVELEYI